MVQIAGDGPVSLLVAEVWQDHRLRATATVRGEVPADAENSGGAWVSLTKRS